MVPGTDCIAADALLDEIGGDRLGEPDHRGLGRAVDITVGHAADRRHRGRDVDDRAGFLFQHCRQERLDHAVHRLDVEIERKIPVLVGAVEHGALVHVACAIDQYIERAERASISSRKRIDSACDEHVELAQLGVQALQLGRIEVGRDHLGALGGEFSAIARPIPCPAAVTSATLSCSLLLIFASRFLSVHDRDFECGEFNAERLAFCRPSFEILRRQPRSKLSLRAGHSLVERRKSGAVAVAALDDHVLAENSLRNRNRSGGRRDATAAFKALHFHS